MLNVNYDEQTGANVQESSLSPQMDWSNFGKVGTLPVDGQIYAQPLYVSGLAIGQAKYNVLYVATMHNSVYAFDADNPQIATPLWKVNLGRSVSVGVLNFTDISPEVGILGTPVIDPGKQVMYLVADTLPSAASNSPAFQLHALSLTDGHEMLGGPANIAASIARTGLGSTAGRLAFDASQQLQRPGLVLANGTLYIGFGSHGDQGSFHGWMLAYNASSLKQTAVFNTTPNGGGAAFWQSGRSPLIAPNGDIFAVTGNGTFDGSTEFGESVLHLDGSNLSLLDWFTPQDWSNLNDQDWDLGSSGAIWIPNTSLLLAAGKAGILYLVQTSSMGHLVPNVGSSVQGVQVNQWGLFTFAVWNQAPFGPTVYEFETGGTIKAFQISKNQINSTILSEYTTNDYSFFGGIAISANGKRNGIVWLTAGKDSLPGEPGTLYALDATNLAIEFWNSDEFSARDRLGEFAKLSVLTVANGRVYVPTFSGAVVVYGALSAPTTAAKPAISALMNSASYIAGPVAPGELVTIFGANLGPSSNASGTVQNGKIADYLVDTQVYIDGMAAPLLFVSPSQINAVVPFGVHGTTVPVQVLYRGQSTVQTTIALEGVSPAIFSMDGGGGGQGAILNQDGSTNSQNNPASPGSVIALFATGGGATIPVSQDGFLAVAPYPAPILPVTVTIDGQPALVVYKGAAPGLIAGALQIDVVVPATAPANLAAPVVVTVGTTSSPSAVTVAIK